GVGGEAGGPVSTERRTRSQLPPLRHGREIGLAVKRCENGAAHESCAAKAGQDGACEPLDGDAAAIDHAALFAVDRQRRLVAEINVLGLDSHPICAAPLSVLQACVPPPNAAAGGSARNPSRHPPPDGPGSEERNSPGRPAESVSDRARSTPAVDVGY